MFGAWVLSGVVIATALAIAGEPAIPALSWLAIAIVSLVARFSRNGIIAGLGFLSAMLVALTFGVAPNSVLHNWSRSSRSIMSLQMPATRDARRTLFLGQPL